MVGGVDGEGAGGKSDVERRRQSSCERCEEYVEHCRTGWFVVTNAQQWVAARLRFHTIGSPATGRSLPSIIQGYLVQNVFAKLPGAPALDPKRAPPLDTELPVIPRINSCCVIVESTHDVTSIFTWAEPGHHHLPARRPKPCPPTYQR